MNNMTTRTTVLQKVVAGLLIINGAIGAVLAVIAFGVTPRPDSPGPFLIPAEPLALIILGLLSAAFSLRGARWAMLLGLLYYAVQIVGFSSPPHGFFLQVGLYFILWLKGSGFTLTLNLVALGFFALGLVAFCQRRPQSAPVQLPMEQSSWPHNA
jgi:hypothetical protein